MVVSKVLLRADTHGNLFHPQSKPRDGTEKVEWKCSLNQVLATFAVSLGSLCVGFASAYTSPALASMKEPGNTIKITSDVESWIGSIMPLSALFGGIFGGPMIENLGRRNTILCTGIPFIISFLLILLAENVAMILTGRAVVGFVVGIASLALPVYLGESVEARVRGTLGLVPTTLGNFGILLSYGAGALLDWRRLALLGACLPLPFFICTFFVPETPGWWLSRNKPEKAREALQWLRGGAADIKEEFGSMVKLHDDSSRDKKVTLKDLKVYSRPFLISLALMFFQQLSGINAIVFYSVSIFKAAGSDIDSNLGSVIIGVGNLVATLVATVLVDKLGRKILLYISNTLMAASLGVLTVFFYYKESGADVSDFRWAPLPAFMIYVFAFAIGAGPIPWLMMGEILPAKIRGSAASIVTAFNWACTATVVKTFIDISSAFGTFFAFGMFFVVCVLCIFFTIKYVPETGGMTLEEIEISLMPKSARAALQSTMGKTSRRGSAWRTTSLAALKPFPTI